MSTWFRRYGAAEVYPRLIIGAYPLDGSDVDALAGEGVDRILNLVQDSEYPRGARAAVEEALDRHRIAEQRIDLVDFGSLPRPELEDAIRTVLRWLAHDHTTYLHCRAGWQRSAAVAAGVVAVSDGIDIVDALALVHARKPTANPLPHQRDDLLAWFNERGLTRRR